MDQIDKLNRYLDRWLIGDDGSYIGAFHMFETEDQLDTMLELHLRKLVEAQLSGEGSVKSDADLSDQREARLENTEHDK